MTLIDFFRLFITYMKLLLDFRKFLIKKKFYLKKDNKLLFVDLFKNFLSKKVSLDLFNYIKFNFNVKKFNIYFYRKNLIFLFKKFLSFFTFNVTVKKFKNYSWVLYFNEINNFVNNYKFIVKFIFNFNNYCMFRKIKKFKIKKVNYISNKEIKLKFFNFSNEQVFNFYLYTRNYTHFLLFFNKKKTNVFLTLTDYKGRVLESLSTGKLGLNTKKRKIKMSRNNVSLFVDKINSFFKKDQIKINYEADRYKVKKFYYFMLNYLTFDKKYLFF